MPSGDIPVLANLSVNSALENKNKRQKNATCCFYYFMLKVNLCRYAAYISYDIARTTRHAFLVGIRNRCKSKYIFCILKSYFTIQNHTLILHSIRQRNGQEIMMNSMAYNQINYLWIIHFKHLVKKEKKDKRYSFKEI